jgi:hypothetical protein
MPSTAINAYAPSSNELVAMTFRSRHRQ